VVDRAWSCGSSCLASCGPDAWGRQRPPLVTTLQECNAARGRLQNHQSTTSTAKSQGFGGEGPGWGRSVLGTLGELVCSVQPTRAEFRHAANNTPTRPRDESPRVPSPQSTTCTTDTVRSAQLAEEIHMTHVTSSTSLHTVHHDAEAPATQAQHTYHITDGAPHRVCTCCAEAAQRLNTDVAADEQVAGWELQRSVQMAPGWGHGAGHARCMMHSTQHMQGRAPGLHGWWRSQCLDFFWGMCL